jgi:hypothetical protein
MPERIIWAATAPIVVLASRAARLRATVVSQPCRNFCRYVHTPDQFQS